MVRQPGQDLAPAGFLDVYRSDCFSTVTTLSYVSWKQLLANTDYLVLILSIKRTRYSATIACRRYASRESLRDFNSMSMSADLIVIKSDRSLYEPCVMTIHRNY
jgi:hypothetical protein